MPLRLLTGRVYAGVTDTVLDRLVADADLGAVPVLLLPSQPDVSRVASQLSPLAPVGIHVTTFGGWLEGLWALHGDGRRLVSAAGRSAIVSRVVEEADLDATKVSAKTPGFQKLVCQLASRLCDPPCTSDDPAICEVASLLVAYDEALETAALVEPSRAAAILAGSSITLAGPLSASGFVDLSDAQERLLSALGAHNDVTIALVWEQGFPATEATDALVARLKAGGAIHEHKPTPASGSELGRLEEVLFRASAEHCIEVGERQGAITFGLAAGRDAEIELVAHQVRAFVDQGIAPERIAVAFREMGPRADRIGDALAACGLDFDLDVMRPVPETPFGAPLLALLRVAGGTGGRADLMSFLDSPYSGTDPDKVTDMDRRWRRGRVDDPSTLLRSMSELGRIPARLANLAREVAGSRHTSNVTNWKHLLDLMLSTSLARRQITSGVDHASLLDAATHQGALRSIEDIAVANGGAVDVPSVVSALQDQAVASGAIERSGAVQVTEVARLRSRRFDAVVLGGLTSSEFSSERPEPLVARVAQRLCGRGGVEERLAERLLFYLLVTRADQALVLVRQATDARGEALRPSLFWEEAVDAFCGSKAATEGEVPSGVPYVRLTLSELAKAVPSFAQGREASRERAAGRRLWAGRALDAELQAEVLESVRDLSTFSVTEIETYGACPYRWFYDRVVRPREIDGAFDVRETGTRAHEMLARFYARLADEAGPRVTEALLEEALTLFEQVADEVEAERANRGPRNLAERLDAVKAREFAREIVRKDADFLPGFAPVCHEFRFGGTGHPEVTVGGVSVVGSIDRIDARADGLVVIDYKTMSSPPGYAKFIEEGMLQIPIYAIVASRLMGKPVRGGVYRSLKSGQVQGMWVGEWDGCLPDGAKKSQILSEEDAAELLGEAEGAVTRIVQRMRTGDITPEPLNDKACKYCGAHAFCPEARVR